MNTKNTNPEHITCRIASKMMLALGLLIISFHSAFAQPANDNCADAIELIPSTTCNPVNGSTLDATQSLPAISCLGNIATTANDVWYKFVAPSSTVEIHSSGELYFDVVLDLHASCNGPSIECSDGSSSTSEDLVATGLIPGNTYYVRVYDFLIEPWTTYGFDICVTYVPCTVTCPNDTTVATSAGLCSIPVNYSPVTVIGTCSNLTYSPPNGSVFNVGNTPVTVTTASGATCTFNVHVNATPIEGGIMHGPTNVCRGTTVTYFRAPVVGAVSYTWQLPAGVTGSSTTNSINVTIGPNFISGIIFCSAASGCNSSTVASHQMDVTYNKPAKPTQITPGGPVCAGSTQFFCAGFVPSAETYIFSISGNGGAAPLTLGLQNNSCIWVNIPAGYNNKQELRVRAVNCKGQSDEQKIDVKVLPVPGMPGNISGPAAVCKSQLGFYSISNVKNATTYNWNVTGNVWIAGGQGTTSLALDYNQSTNTSALISVTAENGCGVSAARTKNVTINTACREVGYMEFDSETAKLDATLYPNPTAGITKLEYTSATETKYTLRIFDITGKIVFVKEIAAIEGMNTEEIDLSSYPKQLYLIRLENGNEIQTLRLVVE